MVYELYNATLWQRKFLLPYFLSTQILTMMLLYSQPRLFLITLMTALSGLLIVQESSAQSFPTGFSQVSVADGINKPTVLTFAPDGRIFVAEQGGKLRVIKNGNLLSTPFISLNVNASGERGLIGIALDPNFASNQYLYLYYTLPDGSRNRISRFTANGDVVVPGSEVVVLDLDPLSNATNHNGGAMHFGTDGKLYVAVGENATPSYAQNLDTYHGKILRINSDGSVPSGNPFPTGSAQKKRVWAYGLRNPYTFDVQPETGKIFVNDVGQNTWEEINDATTGGKNFGWPSAEGVNNSGAYANPVYAYPHGSGDGKGCAITGGVFFNPASTNYPAEYRDRFFFLDYCNRWINTLDLAEGATRASFATSVGGGAVSMEVGTDGNVYYLSRNDGALYKIIYTNVAAPAITDQPEAVSVFAGQPASFSVSVSGATPFTYQWQKDGEDIPGATAATYTIDSAQPSDAGAYRVAVSNSAGIIVSEAAPLSVANFNAEPVAEIITPAEGSLYRAGTTITFSGDATDEEDGTLPASAFTWEVVFHHSMHTHDGPPVASGTKSGSFTIPNQGETSDTVWYRLYLTVTDSEGLSSNTYRDIYPLKSTISFATIPAGLTVTLDGQPLSTPASVVSVEGVLRNLGVVSPQTVNGITYVFDSWQQGGDATQTVATPQEDVTYTAVFKEADVVPAPWQSSDVGNVGIAGSASVSGSTFTLSGSGADIWNQADAFQYVYQWLSGDGEIIARVTDITNTNAWAKAGLMFRETLTANARHASVFVTPEQGVAFQRRTAAGGSSQHTGSSGSAPVWLRLVRTGNSFTSFKSANGSNWAEIGTTTISMGTDVYVGLAVTAHNNGALATATMDNVTVNEKNVFEPVVLEAEDATIVGGQVASNHVGFTGSGFVDYVNPTGDYVQWTVEVPSAGSYTLGFRYALGSSTTRPLEVKVNGSTVASSLAFTTTGSWTTWQTKTLSVNLTAGENTIRAIATGTSGANMDHLRVSAENTNAMAKARPSKQSVEQDLSDLLVFPNPATDELFVRQSTLTDEAQFQLISVSGKVISIQAIREGTVTKLRLPVRSGLYTLMIRDGDRMMMERIVVKP